MFASELWVSTNWPETVDLMALVGWYSIRVSLMFLWSKPVSDFYNSSRILKSILQLTGSRCKTFRTGDSELFVIHRNHSEWAAAVWWSFDEGQSDDHYKNLIDRLTNVGVWHLRPMRHRSAHGWRTAGTYQSWPSTCQNKTSFKDGMKAINYRNFQTIRRSFLDMLWNLWLKHYAGNLWIFMW